MKSLAGSRGEGAAHPSYKAFSMVTGNFRRAKSKELKANLKNPWPPEAKNKEDQ
jgi:hypothetical protein